MKRWRLDLAILPGLLAQGQEMVNHFALEMARACQKRPSFHPIATPGISKEPWRSFYAAYAKSLGEWGVLNISHKKPSPMDQIPQAWIFYNKRFLLDGGLVGAWAPFGGISSQLAHLGMILYIAAIGNATIAMNYAKHPREQVAHLELHRGTTVGWAHFISEEDDVIRRNVLRELGHDSATMRQVAKTKKGRPGKGGKGPPKGDKGGRKGGNGNKKGDKRGQGHWPYNNTWGEKQPAPPSLAD